MLLNGHHFVLQALRLSYESVPRRGTRTERGARRPAGRTPPARCSSVGVKLAAPLIVASFLMNVALAVLARVAPQINVFMRELPDQNRRGLPRPDGLTAPMMVYVFKKLLAGFEENMLQLVKAL